MRHRPAMTRPAAGALAAMAALTLAAPQPLAAQNAETASGVYTTPPGFEQMVADNLPSVVGILSTVPASMQAPRRGPRLPPGLDEFFGQPVPEPDADQGPLRGQGSGFVISEDGLVVTNNHVVAGAETIEIVTEDERRLDAEVVGTDAATDLALLRVDTDETLPAVEWGDSTELEVGEWLVAIGNPFGLGGTVTAGILSARARDINAGPYDTFLQTDAAINRGNSGGPLFNAEGEVVGVNTAIFSPSGGNVGIGFAVPSQLARSVIDDLRTEGRVQRGYLGVRVQTVDKELAAALGIAPGVAGTPGGALVSEVTDASPAAEAGLEPGDVVVGIAGQSVEDARDLTFAVAGLPMGEPVDVAVLREGERQTLSVTIGEQPESLFDTSQPEREAPPDEPSLGVSVAPLDAETREQVGVPEDVTGLFVAQVQPGTPAARADLRRGDVISAAGGAPIAEASALRDAAATAEEEDRPLLLRIWREGAYAFVPVRLQASTEG